MKNLIKETFDEVFTAYDVDIEAHPWVYAEAMVEIKNMLKMESKPIPYPEQLTEEEKSLLNFLAIDALLKLQDIIPPSATTQAVYECVKELALDCVKLLEEKEKC